MKNLHRTNSFLLDFDGTLVDSLSVMFEVYRKFAELNQWSPSKAEFDSLNGPALHEIIAILKKKHDIPRAQTELLKLYQKLISEVYKKEVKPFPDASVFLKELYRQGKTLILTTSSSERIVRPILLKHGWDKLFHGYVFGNEVKNSKPDGEIFLKAIERFNLDPAAALVVEDSVNGVLAGKDAELPVAGITNYHAEKELLTTGASWTFPSLNDLAQACLCRTL